MSMYRIMLADDEGIVLDSLKFLLGGEFGETITIESAKTGRAVIELAEHFRPDIAIMDIHMPGINGLEAMREIRSNNKNVLFIVLSAYDKFDYAKEALGLGALEYLNKPVEKTNLIRVVRKAMGVIDAQREKRSQDLMIKEKMETVIPVLESGFLYNLLLNEHYREDIESYKNLLGLTQDHGFMLALVFGDGLEGGYMKNAAGTSVRLQDHVVRIREAIKDHFPALVGPVMSNKIAVFIPENDEKQDYNTRVRLVEKTQKLVEEIQSKTGLCLRVGIGSVMPVEKAGASYAEALDSLTLTQESVALTQDLPVKVGYEENYPVEAEKTLFESVERGDLNGTLSCANLFFDWMVEQYGAYPMDIRLKALEFVLRAEHTAYRKSGTVYHFQSRQNYLSSVWEADGYEQLREWYIDKIKQACQNVMMRKQRQTDSVVDKAKEYIDRNYSKDISLDEVSRIVDISPYYFSKVFKEATGDTFLEYLTHLRMEKAKDLIEHSEYSMKEICQMVGYADPNYFSRTFKKNVGVTPTDYKLKL